MLQIPYIFGETSSSGIGALGINGQAFLIQLVTFVLAYFLLRKYAFAPILKVLTERRQTIEQGVKLGEEMREERAKLDDEISKTLQEARQQADGILADAHDSARDAAREAEEKARTKADNIIADAHTRTEQDAQRVRRELEKELVGLISDATEVIIDEKVDAKKDAALIDKALKGRA